MSPVNAAKNSSDIIIKKSLKQLEKYQFSNNRMIGDGNYYVNNTVKKTKNFSSPLSSNKKKHISQYIASSTICHCFDGWNYLSRGVDSLLNGDISNCVHLVYYSQLRAVMCLMASQGIGIFDRKHIYFDNTETDILITNKTTHGISNELIKNWAKFTKKDNVFEVLKYNNRPFNEWIKASPAGTTRSYLRSEIRNWFNCWSLDLRLTDNQTLRNEQSYRPHFKIKDVEIQSSIEKLFEIWKVLEPIPSSRFYNLDMHLSRIAFEYLFLRSRGESEINLGNYNNYVDFVDFSFDNLGEPKAGFINNFLKRSVANDDHLIFREARNGFADIKQITSDPIPMICRSLLLLRFATGFCNRLLVESDINVNSLNFWWEDIAVKIGIIENRPTELTPCDLYQDIKDSILNVESFQPLTSVKQLNNLVGADIPILKQFQRTCFWGLGL